MNPIIKWPGGKSREIDKIQHLIPEYKRYVEPFFGGGALYFHLQPERSAINDISSSLMQYYQLIKQQDKELYNFLLCYNNSFSNLVNICSQQSEPLMTLFFDLKEDKLSREQLNEALKQIIDNLSEEIGAGFSNHLLLNKSLYCVPDASATEKACSTSSRFNNLNCEVAVVPALRIGFEILDVGTHSTDSCDYPLIAHEVCKNIQNGAAELGILVCGTGIGMSMAANKHRGIRAACCSDVFSARLTREHNDANILCLGGRVVGAGLAIEMVDVFLNTEFEGGRHQRRVDQIAQIENGDIL